MPQKINIMQGDKMKKNLVFFIGFGGRLSTIHTGLGKGGRQDGNFLACFRNQA